MELPFVNSHAPCVTCANASLRLDCALLRVRDLCSSSGLVCTTSTAPPPQFDASLEDNDFSPAPSDPDDSDAEDDAVDDEEDDEDDDDDGDSGDDNERDAGVDGQLSVHEGVLHKD